MEPVISDVMARRTLTTFARLAARALDDSGAWLGMGTEEEDDEDLTAAGTSEPLLHRVGAAVRERVAGETHPGSSGWASLSPEERTDWWVDRIGFAAAPIVASPRLFGAMADRVPMQAALAVAVQGLAVCAAAREGGVVNPDAWVPLLGRVLMGRDLGHDVTEAEPTEPDEPAPPEQTRGYRPGARQIIRLARIVLALRNVFEDRPRGARLSRIAGKVPLIGVVGGFLDERQAIRRAADLTRELIAKGYPEHRLEQGRRGHGPGARALRRQAGQ